MKLSLIRHFTVFALSVGWFAITLTCASLLVELSWSDGLIRYPEATRVSQHFRLDTLLRGYISQYGFYQTTEELPAVMSWYIQSPGFGLDGLPGVMGECVTFRRTDKWFLVKHMLGITLCAQSKGTLIFVNRNMALHW